MYGSTNWDYGVRCSHPERLEPQLNNKLKLVDWMGGMMSNEVRPVRARLAGDVAFKLTGWNPRQISNELRCPLPV